ncbi:DMSO/TMAO reductase YedYZ molybdopterin-dependent catalytic subunit [Microbacterium sp. AK009]|uniref:molybdopterin-dependent oxidoreductase n=1 Tax=Microbacterium sp. AK009 TaxID=2723068 RepID=UPI0015C73AC5|nr:molybdopterin-dependent oxidoreductase [Microbacterium sp. AK009]NYF18334.1 DMSO/TMAO reductase YedYZ molybdopterin-dependent catalytic subunit [Microbacterium sp. AK009]
MTTSTARRPIGWAAASGIIAAAAFLAAAELVALLVARSASPILAVGSFLIDIVPQPIKEFAISTFGDADKVVLLIGIGCGVVVAAAAAGVLQYVRPPLGVAALALAGILSGAATLTRAGATPLSVLPPLVGTVAGVLALILLVNRLRRWRAPRATAAGVAQTDAAPAGPQTDAAPRDGQNPVAERSSSVDRRAFLRAGLLTAAAAVVVGAGSRVVNAATSSLAAVREELALPAPRTTVTIPDGASFDIPGLSPLITPNDEFYRVDTALTVPSIDPATWRLRIDGMVDTPVELSFDDLVAMGLDEYAVTLTCVSNEVGGGLVGNAVWLGVPLRDVLRMAGPQEGADMVLSRSVDGYTASTPLSAVTDDGIDAILAVGMNGEPLPFEHGFPVRMVVPGLYGYVSATKWLTQLTVTTFAQDEAYWTPRGYSAEAPIKFSSRIDTPRTGTPIPAGRTPIAGMAWAQTVGIERVEVSIDDGPWQQATLSTPINDDTWVQWFLDWDATAGTHYVAVRAVNRDGETQIQERAPIAPDGSTGWQRVLVTVR